MIPIALHMVLPAYAGMIPYLSVAVDLVQGAPRVCGDDPRIKQEMPSEFACSPRMRG